MAAELTQDEVLHFLQSRGGSVTNSDLLLHFRPFLREHADRERNRELFKGFVNSVARVKQEDGVSHVVLQRRFRGQSPGVGSGGSAPPQGNVRLSPHWNADRSRSRSPDPKSLQPGAVVLPAAGIILSNNNNTTEPNLNLPQRKVQQSYASGPPPHALPIGVSGRGSEVPPAQAVLTPAPQHTGLPEVVTHREVAAAPVTSSELRDPKLKAERAPVPVSAGRPSPPPHSLPQTLAPPVHAGYDAAVSPGRALSNMPQHRQPSSAKPVPPHLHSLQPAARAPRTTARHRQSYRSALSLGDEQGEDDDAEEEHPPLVVPDRRASAPLGSLSLWELGKGRGAAPALETSPSRVQVQGPERSPRSEEPHGTDLMKTPPQALKVSTERTVPQIHIQDLDPGSRQDPQPRFRTGFPLPVHNSYGSHHSVGQSWRGGRGPSPWSSCEELSRPGGGGAEAGQGREQSADEESPRGTRDRAWHHSTGDLCDEGPDTGSGSAPSPPTYLRPAVTRRQSSKLKRMCLSVGADLDQLMDEEDRRALGGSEAARLHRLQLISSSLSLGHMSSMSSLSSSSTPPRSHSMADLTDRDTPKASRSTPSTPQHQEGASRQSHVPLEEREHLWLVKAASGIWPDIYSLFREDPSLLHKRDFISGFTILHWIAKHGDHRVLNTLWYGVEKSGLMFDTDAQSSCGYTSLHIAAIHNHKNIIRLLVNKFKANVNLRDAAGRKAWFYLPPAASPELFKLLGAPARVALGPSDVGQGRATPQTHPQTQRRRRRHHFSSASGQRPVTFSGGVKVKRSSSLAVFLKHKSLQKVKAEWAI